MANAAPDEDYEAWFRLLETPGVGRETARRLLAACGSPTAVFGAGRSALRAIAGAAVADALAATPPQLNERWQAVQRWRGGGEARHLLALGDPRYPSRLLQTADPPLMLYLQGPPELLAADAIAVVGSRHATPQGLETARAFGRALSERQWVVISGLAAGIDGAAHEGALAGAAAGGAATVAVVGTGLDLVYPARHRELARRIAERGALLSEYAPGTPPLAEHFPQRNRLIAGLALGTLVVEAALKSGSLITARLAAEAGREVFAVPGSIHAPQSRGCHALLRQGAKLVETAEDIVEELAGIRTATATKPTPTAAGDGDESDPLLRALGHAPATLDALLARTGWPTAELTARLLELEFDGQVARMAGGLYQRLGRA
ncbi:Rossmann fold nucleotide-binding protein Smf possibly involved in DNA uptake [Rubrivivax sp. A210]|uniref:DNA-processing protein DprA n=1 Tax=Rubrivivax sp. A210 TaxID=2772301 RepID=UPI001918147E|nr:DNA-processing protein DprA [Rubrivivax sp. A210]CAD5375242.1 Rossmann fold nucleotide-binding protein Smf possibly involved in DNA uptake [Rubrivivax sp. A210]